MAPQHCGGPWYKGPKQRTRSHTTAVPLCEGSLPLAVVAAAEVGVVDVVVRARVGLAGLTHIATKKSATRGQKRSQQMRMHRRRKVAGLR